MEVVSKFWFISSSYLSHYGSFSVSVHIRLWIFVHFLFLHPAQFVGGGGRSLVRLLVISCCISNNVVIKAQGSVFGLFFRRWFGRGSALSSTVGLIKM